MEGGRDGGREGCDKEIHIVSLSVAVSVWVPRPTSQ